MTDPADRAGRTALVTGGSAGMGRGIAHRFLRSGMRVMVTGRDPDSLADAQDQLGPDALVVSSDAEDRHDIQALATRVESTFGGLDVLVLNAGISGRAPFEEVTERQVDEVFATNLKGPFFSAQILGPLLRPGGAIVVTTSISNTMGRVGNAHYDASKAALRSLTRSLAAEFLAFDATFTTGAEFPVDGGQSQL